MITARTLTMCALVCLSIPAVFTGCETHSRAKQIMKQQKCLECHTIKGVGGSVGPNLSNVGARRSRDYIFQQLKDPKSYNVNSQMPSFKDLPDQDLKALADYLSSLK
jgi:mono/diheme cytochrome c family protein